MSGITPAQLARFVEQLAHSIERHEQGLNAADAKLGDGDTGSMLRRVLKAMASAETARVQDLSEAAMQLAQAAMKETGSSLGTLVATGAMTLAKHARSSGNAITPDDLPDVVSAMRDAIASRGKASPGDKTIIDSLDAIAKAGEGTPLTLSAAAAAARVALDAFRDRQCMIGRARMFPERSRGSDDPGMLAMALLLNDLDGT